MYETFGQENYDRFFKEYMTNLDIHHGWADNDFGKPGIEYVKPRPEHRRYTASLRTLHLERHADYDIVTVEMKLPEVLSKQYGAPRQINVIYSFHANEPVIEVSLSWRGKPACRLPEASWLSFVPLVDNPNAWSMDKLGMRISPLSVVKDGNRNMHGIHTGLYYEGRTERRSLNPWTRRLCARGTEAAAIRQLLCPVDRRISFQSAQQRMGTNFMMWFEDDMKYRFRLSLHSHS